MKKVPPGLLDQLDFQSAVQAEADAWRNQIPPEPWHERVKNAHEEVAAWVRGRLAAGLVAVPSTAVNARKPSLGVRPVPIMGIGERVAYRAIAAHVLRDIEPVDRSADAYRDFLHGPIEFALASGSGSFRTLGTAHIGYVVEADVAAFYQYIDHEILRQQLEMHTGEIEAIDLLIELLRETEQRAFGLPQLIDPSDWLSEIYAQYIERDLLRRGLHVWRFNDDFRIGCVSYTDALDAIERLEEAARSIGLSLSDGKTFTPRFLTYYAKTTGLDVSDTTVPIDPSDVEVIVAEYPDLDDDEQVAAALATLERLTLPPEDDRRIALEKPASEEIRDLRRAISALARNGDEGGLRYVKQLLAFVPSLTPRLSDYLIASYHEESASDVEGIVDSLIEGHSLGEWQAMWLVYVLRALLLLQGSESRIAWTREQRDRGRGRALGAEAALTLAGVGEADFDDLDQALRTEPEALAPWYMLAVADMARLVPTTNRDRARAIRDSHPLARVLVDI